MASGFDRVARIYRWGEKFTFGPLLMRCRTAFLDDLRGMKHVLVLGDGDGRFTATALTTFPDLRITAVDSSAAMLQRLLETCHKHHVEHRVETVLADARTFRPTEAVDAICTHFFLDCLSSQDVDALAQRLALSTPTWIVSEFDIPQGPVRLLAHMLVRSLYLSFRVLTGLQVQQLPDWRGALQRAGFRQAKQKVQIRGILTAELWLTETADALPRASD